MGFMIPMRIQLRPTLLTMMACLCAQMTVSVPVHAESVTFRFSGKVTQVEAPLGDTIKQGDPVSVKVTFNSEVAPRFAGLPWYPVIGSSITFHAENETFTAGVVDAPREDIVINDRTGQFNTDQWLWGATSGDGRGGVNPAFESFSINEQTIIDYNVHLTDNTATAFSTDALPSNLNLSKFGLRQGWAQFGMAGHDIRFSIDDLIVNPDNPNGPADTAPDITSFSVNEDGSFTITWKSAPGTSYHPWSSLNLLDWNILDIITANAASTSFTFPAPEGNAPNAFFGIEIIQAALE